MKWVAVILAAIAALAATAQAYLSWKAKGLQPALADIRNERVSGCKQIIGSLARFERLSKNPDETIRAYIEQGQKVRREYPEEFAREGQLTPEKLREMAERQYLYMFFSSASELQEFVDVSAMFFSDGEIAEFGIEDIENAVGGIDRYAGYVAQGPVLFDERVSLFAKAASHLPAVRAVCSRVVGPS